MKWVFLIFCMRLQQYKETENLVKLFWENSISGVLGGKKAPKWAQNEVFEVLWRTKVWQVSSFLWSYSTLRAWNCLKQLVYFWKILFRIVLAETILVSRELKLWFCFLKKFFELSVRIIPVNVKIDCGTENFGKAFVLQSFFFC